MKFLIPFLLISCANIQHLTNTNLSEMKNLSRDREYVHKLNKEVKEISGTDHSNCRFLQDVHAKDNALEAGEQVVIIYLKDKVLELEGNALQVEKIEKRGDYYFEGYGKAYLCEDAKASKLSNKI